jgi:hypothetical protein
MELGWSSILPVDLQNHGKGPQIPQRGDVCAGFS